MKWCGRQCFHLACASQCFHLACALQCFHLACALLRFDGRLSPYGHGIKETRRKASFSAGLFDAMTALLVATPSLYTRPGTGLLVWLLLGLRGSPRLLGTDLCACHRLQIPFRCWWRSFPALLLRWSWDSALLQRPLLHRTGPPGNRLLSVLYLQGLLFSFLLPEPCSFFLSQGLFLTLG